MPYCHNCGEKLPDNAFFCPKCGTKTVTGVQSGASSPADDMRDALMRMSAEMEKAFTIAAKEVHEAFKQAKDNIQKTVVKESVICPNCGEKNPASATYCFKCGKKLGPETPTTTTGTT
jgi:ribosomal protein L40E